MSDFLKKIRAVKEQEVENGRRELPLPVLKEQIESSSFRAGSFSRAFSGPGLQVIAEVKKASPSRGILRQQRDIKSLVAAYERGGAAAISVLTEERFFKGSYQTLARVASQTSLPVLHKEFIIHPWQIYRGRAAGAAAVLLIVALLTGRQLEELYFQARELGMDCLVEVHNRRELERAKKLKPAVIGVNNRNLKTLTVEIKTCLDLAGDLPDAAVKIAESGIRTGHDVRKIAGAGFDGVLVGEALVEDSSPEKLLAQFRAAGAVYV